MMHSVKILSALALLTAFIITVSLVSYGILDRTSTDLQKSISGVEADTTAENWENAEQGVKQIKSKWAGVSKTWSILIDHQEIDNIEFTLSKMEKLISVRDKNSALAESSALMNYVRHIPRKENLNFQNIF